MRLLSLGSIASISLLALGCQAPTSGVISTNRPIINGDPDNIATHAAVVALTDNTGFAFCTGTYVGSRTIVSAGHCLEGGAPAFAYFGGNANTDANACVNGSQAACNKFIDVIATDDPGFNGQTLLNDLSVVKMSTDPVINGVTIQPIPFTSFADGTQLTAADEGDLVSFSGFGVTDGATQSGGGVKLVVGNIPLVAVGPDAATGIDGNQVFYNQPLAIGGPCNGDSGGPMFVTRNGVEFLAAVTSFGDQTCTDFGVSTRVDVFDDFINTFCGGQGCAQGGGGGQNEICNNNFDDDGDGAVDCADIDCSTATNCQQQTEPENCEDGVDNDLDGDTDCDDSFCANADACQPGRFCAVTPASPSHNETPVVLVFALFGLSLLVSRRTARR